MTVPALLPTTVPIPLVTFVLCRGTSPVIANQPSAHSCVLVVCTGYCTECEDLARACGMPLISGAPMFAQHAPEQPGAWGYINEMFAGGTLPQTACPACTTSHLWPKVGGRGKAVRGQWEIKERQ